ncbi:MAG: hypothetical protein KIH62_001010 [Candidatus Kerfeldbacteria bacterium]|nr:hypothetical protein [Candidatus Kerfeldbacteria bacterium]
MKNIDTALTFYRSCVAAWKRHPLIGALVLWSISMIVYAYMLAGPVFADPDSFYHIKMAELMIRDKGPVVEFPWLAFTTLTQSYVDHHFLYHAFLIPWILLFGDIIGAKVATVVLASTTIALFYLALRQYKVPIAFFCALLLMCNPDFSFRMLLTKATTVGFIFMISGLMLILKRNYRLLALCAFFFVWSYGGFLLLAILSIVCVVVRTLMVRIHARRFPHKKMLLMLGAPLLVVGAGTFAALLIHPSFPNHFRFYWEQIIQIGFVNYSDTIGVGGEWYPYNISDLAGSMIVSTIIYVVSIILAFWHARKLKEGSWITLIMSFFFLLFTLKSRRYVEYLIPWSLLASAYVLTDSGVIRWCMHATQKALSRWNTYSISARAIIIASSIGFLVNTTSIMWSQIHKVEEYLQSGLNTRLFADAGRWLQTHATAGDIVFHDNWSTFPLLFYNATKPYYIVGLDATFMYRHNPDLYWEWAKITLNTYEGDIYPVIADHFRARFVFVDSEHPVLKAKLDADPRFVEAYHDDEATIYRIPRNTTGEATE